MSPYLKSGRGRTSGIVPAVAGWAVMLALLSVYTVGPARATDLYANPGDNIRSIILNMDPGDTLHLAAGDYVTNLRMTNQNGDPDNWHVVRGPDVGVARIVAVGYYNQIELTNSSYWRLENLELDGIGVSSEAFKAQGTYAHHIVLDGLNVHDYLDVTLDTKAVTWDMTIKNCHVHDGGSVGLYLGNSTGYGQLINFTFDNNLVERTYSYNMQIKQQNTRTGIASGTQPGFEFDSWGWEIKNSVFMRTLDTAGSARPNFLIDAAPMSGPGNDDLATIHGNVVLGNVAGAAGDHGFQLSGNLRVYNNVILNVIDDGVAGIRIGSHAGINPRFMEVYNNTVFILGGTANTRCLSITDVLSGPGMNHLVANNALIRGNASHTAFSSGGAGLPGDTVVANNIIRGGGVEPGFALTSEDVEDIFVSPVDTPGVVDLYPDPGPRSPLIDAGDNAYAPADDFNGTVRPYNGIVDVGAYEYDGPGNPGWQLDLNFKGQGPPIPGDFDADWDVDLDDYALLVGQLTGPGTPAVHYESDGLVAIEAEHFNDISGGVPPVDDAWVLQTGGGSVADGYMQALPDNGDSVDDPDIESLSPRLSYVVDFTTAGTTYYLWTRGAGPDASGDSFHYGFDGECISSDWSDAAYVAATGQLGWSSSLGGVGRPTIYVASPGVHTLDVWMREDGCMIDRLLLTTDPSYAPSAPDDPPDQSNYDLNDDGYVDLRDVAVFTANFTG